MIQGKHSYSKGFGVRLQCFSLASILEKRGDLRYNVATFKDGVPCISSFPSRILINDFSLVQGIF